MAVPWLWVILTDSFTVNEASHHVMIVINLILNTQLVKGMAAYGAKVAILGRRKEAAQVVVDQISANGGQLAIILIIVTIIIYE